MTEQSTPTQVQEVQEEIGLTIISAITASLEKKENKGDKYFVSELGLTWNAESADVVQFVKRLERSFDVKNKFYSYFSGLQSNKTPSFLTQYINDKNSFSVLSGALADSIMTGANSGLTAGKSNLSGGHLIFIHYKLSSNTDDAGKLLIVLVNNKSGFKFNNDKDMQPEKLNQINLDQMRQAAMFDLTLFSSLYPSKAGDPYLHFITGLSTSDFFKESLGCDAAITNETSAENLYNAFSEYINSLELKGSEKAEAQRSLDNFLQSSQTKEILLDKLSSHIKSALPDSVVKSGSFVEFQEYANQNNYKINHVFQVTRGMLEKNRNIYIKDDRGDFTLSIKLSSFLDDADKLLSEDGKSIIIPLTVEQAKFISDKMGNEKTKE